MSLPGATTGRASWQVRVSVLPLAYLAGVLAVCLGHPLVPLWRWLAIHLLLLGAATNAIVIWSAHFTAALLRAPAPSTRLGEAIRLVALNLGIGAVLVGGGLDLPWVGVPGAAVVFAAIVAQLAWLAGRLRQALPARFAVTVHYYLVAAVALLVGIPVGAWMLVVDDQARPRLLLFHAHVNLLGWITLTVLGTLVTLWPTVLRTRLAEGAVRAATAGLPIAITGLALLGVAVLAWWPQLAAGGLALVAISALTVFRPALTTARAKPPASFAAWSIAAAGCWLLIALGIDAWTLLAAHTPAAAADRFQTSLVPLLVGFVAQVLMGALAYLLPVVLGGGPAKARERTELLDRYWPQRVAMGNAALVVLLLPTVPYVRLAMSLLIAVALAQFLFPAVRVVSTARR